jgi:hypothetical protein
MNAVHLGIVHGSGELLGFRESGAITNGGSTEEYNTRVVVRAFWPNVDPASQSSGVLS